MNRGFKNIGALLIAFAGFFFGQTAGGQNKTINVNLYANNDPYNNSQWNNQLITQASYPFTSGAYNYSDGSVSGIFSTISASQTPTSSTYADNGAGYPTTMCPPEVGRYASYWPSTRTITFQGLNNTKFYTIQLYCSRVTSQGTTRNTINGVNVDIAVFNNFTSIATYTNIVPSGGQIVVTQTPLNAYVYLNGFTLTEKTTAGNQSPTANAGTNQTIILPASQVTLTGSGTDADGTIATYGWTQLSGTAATIASPSAASTNITGLTTAGVRVFRLTVTDNQGATGTADVTITVNAAGNQSPTANAGSGQTITLPVSQVTLSGSGTDPDGTIASYGWTQVSGTAATIATPSAASTNITGLTTAGVRVFRLTVTDNQGATGTNDVTITVNAAGNQSPTANAGSGQTITLPVSQVTLSGSGTDPDGTIASYGWTQVSGTAATIASPSAASTNITGLTTAGVRVFRLTVTDNLGATGTNDVTITVNAGANQSPTANAGLAQIITLPTSQVTLSGSGTDPDGTIASYGWTQVSGTAATIASPSAASTNITGLTTAGVRVFRLTVTDNQGATGTNDVTITVNSSSSPTPFGGTRRIIPGKLEAEDFDNGGQNIAYFDGTNANSGGAYRPAEFVDLGNCGDTGGGYNIGWTLDGEWVKYSVTVTTTGTYTFTARVGTPNTGKTIQFQVDGTTVGTLTVANTGSYTTWQTATLTNVPLTAGDHIFRFLFNTGDANNTNFGFDINWFNFALASNQSPTANAGSSQTIMLPSSQVTLSGSGTDPDGTIASYAWTQVGGTAATIASPSSASTNITGLTTAGVRVFRLTVTDNFGATGTNDVTVTVNANGSLPVVTTNNQQTVVTPTASLTSSASSGAGIASTRWSKFSVPGQTLKSLTVVGSSTSAGNGTTSSDSAYVNRLKAYYQAQGILGVVNNLAISGTSVFDVNITGALNLGAPILLVNYPSNAYAGSTYSIPVICAKYQQIADSCAARGVQFYTTGTQPRDEYNAADRLKLNVINDSLRNRFGARFIDFLTFALTTSDNSIKPEYAAGDGIHLNNAAHERLFQLVRAANIFQNTISSPSVISSPSGTNTNITGLTNGVHQFQVSVIDNAGYAASAVAMISYNTGPNAPPVARAGVDQTITLPVNAVSLIGTTSSDDHAIISYQWTKLTGTGGTLTTPTASTTTFTGLSQGTYTVELRVTDDSSAIGRDTVQITVNPVNLNVGIPNGTLSYSKNTWTSLLDFDSTGAPKASLVGGKIQITGGDWTNFGNALTLRDTIAAAHWTGTVRIQMTTPKAGNNYGLTGFARSVNSYSQNSLMIDPDMSSGSFNGRTQFFYNSAGSGNVSLFRAGAGSRVAYNQNDRLLMTLTQNCDTLRVYVKNVTTNAAPFDTTFIVPNKIVQASPTNLFEWGISAQSGGGQTVLIDSVGFVVNEPLNATLLLYGDSKTTGVGATNNHATWAYQLRQNYPSMAIAAGGGNRTQDALAHLPEVLALAPKNVLLAIGSNDVRTGVADALWKARYQSLTSQLMAAGINVVHLLPMKENGLDLTAQKDWVIATYPGRYIDTWTPSLTPGFIFNDNIHLSDSGNARTYRAILQALPPFLGPGANAGTNQVISIPVSQVTLTGTGTAFNGGSITYGWSQLSGTPATIVSPTSATTNITGLTTPGIRVFHLTVTDNLGATGTSDVTITVNDDSPPPVVTANNPQTIKLPTDIASLTSTASSSYTISSIKWTKFSVPGQTVKRVTVVGSSASAGNGATASDSAYVNKLKAYYKAQGILDTVYNLAVSGTSVFNVDITAALNKGAPVLLAGYSSYGYQGSTYSVPTICAKFQEIADSCTARGVQFYITGTQPRDDYNAADRLKLNVINDSLRNRFGARFIDFLTPVLNTSDNSIKTRYAAGDAVNLNNSGHERLFQSVRAANIFQNSISSPSVIVNPVNANTAINSLDTGVNKFQVSILDNGGYAASAVATVIVNPATPNQAPLANAGADKAITLPVDSILLDGTASTDDHNIIAWQWTKLTGTGGTFTTPVASTTKFKGLTPGVYTVELMATDDSSAVSRDTVQITVNPPLNKPPVINAGADQVITQPASSVSLSGTATDDHNITGYQWTKLSGTGGTLTTPTALTTTFTGLSQGIYKVELRVTDDSSAVSRDTVQITVNFPPNAPPVARAGADQVIISPSSSVTLDGTTSTDDHTITGWQWTKLTGLGGTLTTSTASTTTFTGLSAGIYTIELRVTDDSSAVARDTVQVTVIGPSILNPADPVITYDSTAPPAQPQQGQIGKWVRTLKMTWNTDSWKPYIINSLAFRLKFPKTYNPYANDGKRYPMIIFLHGKGEVAPQIPTINYDNEFSLANGGPFFTNAVDNGTFDGYILIPQASPGGWAPSNFTQMVNIIDYMVANNKLDPFQIILNGLSDGAFNLWETTNFKPSLIAARMPMSGISLGNIADTAKLKFTPIWHFQGGLDVNPAPVTSYLVKNAFDSAGSNFLRNTLYPDLGHGTWDAAWNEPDFLPFVKRAYGSNPWPLFARTDFCANDVISNVTLGVAPGFDAYQWRKDSVMIPGATTNTINVAQVGRYDVRVLRGTVWSEWSRTPVNISLKYTTVTPTIAVSGLMSRVIPALDTSGVTLKEPAGYVSYTWQKVGNNTTIGTDSTLNVTTAGDYIVKVAELYGCSSNFSNPFTVIDANGPNKPDAPTNLSVSTVSKTSLRLDWSQNPAPQYNETNFEIYQSLQPGGSYKLVALTGADVSSYVVTGLTLAGTKYYYKLRAVNNTGASAASNEANGTTDIDTQAPTAPTNLTVSGTTRSAVFLTWGAATDEVGVAAYDVYVGGVRSYTTTQTQFIVNALNYGQSYNFTVKARDFAGNVSVASNQVTGQPLLTGLNYKQYTFTGNWANMPNFNSLTPVTTGIMSNVAITPRTQNDNFAFLWQGYISIPTTGIYYFRTNSDDGSKLYLGALDGIGSPYSYGGAAIVDNDGVHGAVDVTSAPLTLTAGVYPIAITFYDQSNSESMTVTWRTPSTGTGYVTIPDNAFIDGAVFNGSAPSGPSNLTATTASYKRINLNWSDNSNNETGFEIWRSTSPSTGFNTVAVTAANVNSFGDSSVLNGATTYYYKIRAIGQYGESAYSGTANATTSVLPAVPGIPGNLIATATSSSAVNITWTQPLQPPTADAGSAQTIQLPTSQATLTGSGVANNGGTITYAWTQVSGTAGTIVSPSSAITNITGLTTVGVRIFRLTVTDNQGSAAASDVTVTVNPVNLSTPFGGTRRTIPGKLEAEDYDNGGQNTAYFDGTAGNTGGQYRLGESVDLGNCGDTGGGYNIGWTTDGEWVKYSVNVTTTGTYIFTARVGTPNTGKSIQFQVDGATVGTLTVANTGGYGIWQTNTLNNVQLTAGDHVFRFLLNTGDASNTNFGFDINWFNFALAPNQLPSADAGSAQTITLPTSQVTLTGTGSANNGGTITYAWTRVSGPNAAPALSIVTPTAASTNVTGLIQGTYIFRLTVTRNDNQTATSDVTITVNPVPPPTASAGSNQTITLPTSQVTLTGSGTAGNGGTITYAWTRVSGPNTAPALSIVTPTTASTNVTGLIQGTYVFRLTITRSGDNLTATSDVTITVNPSPPPTANAGSNQTIILPTSQVTLAGSGTAGNGGTITYAWTRVSGPNTAPALSIVTPAAASTNVTGLIQGTYVFRLTVTRSGDNLTATSDVTVTVNAVQPPTANAGTAQAITLPTSQVTLTGSGTAGNGGALTYAWTQVSGTAATITTASAASTTVTGLSSSGVRVFRLTVTQSDNQTATNDVTITVNPASNGKTIPGKVEAESWDAKIGGMYAIGTTDVGGGLKVVGITNGSSMDYNVNVVTTGTYTVNFRIATTQALTQFQVKLGNTVLGTINIPSSGDWNNWITVPLNNISLSAGAQTLRILSTNNETCDFNWMDFVLTAAGNNQPVVENINVNQPMAAANTASAGTGFQGPVTDAGPVSPVTGFELYRSANNNTNYLLLATLPANAVSFTDSSLFPNAIYYYKVRAINAGGPSAYSNEDSALTANHPPVITKLNNRTARYGITTVIPVTATDADAGILSFTIQNKPAFATFVDNGDRSATLTLNPAVSDQNTYNNIRIIVNDVNGGADTTIFNLTVNDNYDPVISSIPNYTLNENDSLSIPLTGTDQNAADSLIWAVSNLPNVFSLTPVTANSATLLVHPTYAAAGVYIVQVNVSDGKGGAGTRQFTLTVNEKNPNTRIYTRIKFANDIGVPWNNITGITTANLKDEFNNTTTVGLNFQQPFWSPFNGGPVTGNNSGIYPDAVLNDFWYFGYNGGPQTAAVALTGLNPAKKYNLTFYAGSVFNGVTDNGTTTYTVGAQTVSLYVQNNTQNAVSISNITPAVDGSITVNLAKAVNSQIGYLNALVLTAIYDDGTTPATPKTLTALYIAGQGIKLSWQDVAYNESGYEVYRSLSAGGTFTLLGTTQSDAVNYTDSTISGLTQYYYKIRAINSYGSSGYSNVTSITTTNRIPRINPISDVTIKNNQTLAVNVTATDDATDHITLTASGLPSFATFVDNGNGTGVVNIQPVSGSLGIYTGITITAKDNSDSSRSTSFSIYVIDANLSSSYVNITDLSNPAPAPWNNMSIVYLPLTGSAVSNLKDDSNISTGISVTLADDWQAVSLTGMRRRNGSELYPESVSRAGIYFTDNTTHHITVSGLNPAKKYNFVFYSSHNTSESTLTNFAISTQTVSLNGCHNSNKTVQLNGIVPAGNGQVTINVTKDVNALSGLLSALVIQSYTPGVVSVFSPADLRVLDYSPVNTISLQWQDRADNETGYEVWRANDGGTYSLITTLAANSTSYVNGGLSSNTTYNYVVRAKNGAVYSSYSNAVRASTYTSTVYININTNSAAGSPWNNLNWIYGLGAVWNNFRNDAGVPTNMGMLQPVKIDGMVSPGFNTGNNSGVFPDAVLAESFGLFPGKPSYIKLTGLNLSKTYDITLTASITGLFGDNTTGYTINGKTCLFNSNMNKDGTLTMFGIVPDQNGEMIINFVAYPGATFALLGAIVIKAYTPSVITAPAIPGGTVNNLQVLTEEILPPAQVVAQESGIITVYPDPFDQYITLSVPATGKNNIRVMISDINGRLVYEKQYDNLVQGKNLIRIEPGNTKGVPPGIYFVRVIYIGKGEEKTIKIIKQR